MRLIIMVFSFALFSAACSSSGSKNSGVDQEHLAHIHLDVAGMTCEGCEKAIVASIHQLEGIQEATASHINKEAMIVFDSTKTSISEISQAITDAGYSVEGEAADPHH